MVKAHRHGRAASWLLPSVCSSRARARQCADGDGYRPIVRERVPKSAGGSELGLQLWRGWPVVTLPPRGGARAPAVGVRLESQRHRRKEDARRGRGLTAAIADTMASMKQPAKPSSQEVPAGIVERVTFHNAENGFCVLRIKARGHGDLVTVVGHAATISAGEWALASGEWVNDRTHGQQFKARFITSTASGASSSVGNPQWPSSVASLSA